MKRHKYNKITTNIMVDKKLLILSLFLILNLYLISADPVFLGTAKQNDVFRITQTCPDATYINITSVSYPNNNIAVSDIAMTSLSNNEYDYYFNKTEILGRYDVLMISDGCTKTTSLYFEISPSGFDDTLGFYFLLIGISGGIILLGFTMKDEWFVVAGGMAFLFVGLYSINQGIAGQRDMFITWGIGLFEIFLGGYLSIKAGLEVMNEN